MRLLVTGGSGFLGEYVLRAASAHGHEITALARSRAAAAKVGWLGAQPIRGDLADAGSLAAAFEAGRCEALINLASLGSGHAPAIIEAAKAAGIPRAVFLSTTAVTTTLPAASGPVRLAAEQEIRESGLDWTILRPTMIYGAAGRPEPVPAAGRCCAARRCCRSRPAPGCSSRCTWLTWRTRCWPPPNGRARPG